MESRAVKEMRFAMDFAKPSSNEAYMVEYSYSRSLLCPRRFRKGTMVVVARR